MSASVWWRWWWWWASFLPPTLSPSLSFSFFQTSLPLSLPCQFRTQTLGLLSPSLPLPLPPPLCRRRRRRRRLRRIDLSRSSLRKTSLLIRRPAKKDVSRTRTYWRRARRKGGKKVSLLLPLDLLLHLTEKVLYTVLVDTTACHIPVLCCNDGNTINELQVVDVTLSVHLVI